MVSNSPIPSLLKKNVPKFIVGLLYRFQRQQVFVIYTNIINSEEDIKFAKFPYFYYAKKNLFYKFYGII